MPRAVTVDLVISREYDFKSSGENLCVSDCPLCVKQSNGTKEIGVKVIVSYSNNFDNKLGCSFFTRDQRLINL